MFALSACLDDDSEGPNLNSNDYDPPVWQDSVSFVSNIDTTPEAQIDLFVAANNLSATTTSSGLVYVILEEGAEEKPNIDSGVIAWYKGYTVDGEVFDQSRNTPFASQLSLLIRGWQEAIPLLGKDGKMWMLLPPSLAYGNDPPSNGNRVLVFEVELADFQ